MMYKSIFSTAVAVAIAAVLCVGCGVDNGVSVGESGGGNGGGDGGGNGGGGGNSGSSKGNAIALTENVWMDGSIDKSDGEVWYSFTADAEITYHVWWNSGGYSWYGDGTKTLYALVKAYDSKGTELFSEYDGWGTPKTITLLSGSTVYLKVTPRSGTGTFAIGYSTGNVRSNFRINPPSNHSSLTARQWTNGSLTASVGEVWYSFTADAGTTYGIWWRENTADAVDIQVRAYDSDGNELFNEDAGWTAINAINVSSGGTVYIRVLPKSMDKTGNYSIVYSAGIVRPDFSLTPLTENLWADDSITTSGNEVWYSFTAAAEITYRVWWNSGGYSWYGDDTKTLYAQVRAYDSNGNELFNEYDGWSTPKTITLLSGSAVYLRVTPRSGTGTFAIGYSTGNVRSDFRISPPANPSSLTARQWTNGSITASVGEVWYSFAAAAGTTYGIWWRENTADAVDIVVRVYDSRGNELLNKDAGWIAINAINVSSGGTVYVRVIPKSIGKTGNYSIAYSAGIVRPDFSNTPLTENVWADGNIAASDGEAWYSFTAAAGTTYCVWWNSGGYSWYGDQTKTLYAQVRAYDGNGNELFNEYDGWGTPKTITLLSGSTVYLRVNPRSDTGTFAIVYSTGEVRP